MDNLFQDLRFGARMLARNPAFTFVAVMTLALGIGANTAIFSVVNAVVLRPLPYMDPDRLVMIWEDNTKEGVSDYPISAPDFLDFQKQSTTFQEIGAVSPRWNLTLTGSGDAERVHAQYASASLFSTLGVSPVLGRVFLPDEDRQGAEGVVVLSHHLWQTRFGADQKIVGNALTIDGNSFTVAGVMPAGFRFLDEVDLWVPLQFNPMISRGRSLHMLRAVGRLRPGVTIEQAQAEMSGITRQLEQAYPDSNAGLGANLVPLHEQVVGDVRLALMVLLGGVGFILLIACANVASLLLARATARGREAAIRAALGAGRGRLARQFLTESLMLAVTGGTIGLALAVLCVKGLVALSPESIPRHDEIGIDPLVLGFCLVATILTGALFGLVPALIASRPDLHGALKYDSQRAVGGAVGGRLRNILVVAEIALAMVLLIGAGLLINSFSRLIRVDPGFETENVLTMSTLLPRSKYSDAQQRIALGREFIERIEKLPGVIAAGATNRIPLGGENVGSMLTIEGRPVAAGQEPEVEIRIASPNYFRALGVPLLAGRFFDERDDLNAQGFVAIINEVTARRFFSNEDPLGKRIQLGGGSWITIVGVAGAIRHSGLEKEPGPEVFMSYYQRSMTNPFIAVRTASDPRSMIGAIRSQLQILDKDLPLSEIRTIEELVSTSIAQPRFNALLLAGFAALALVLAAVGIYGIISYWVSRRTREIGIRQALGAQRGDVLKLVLGQAVKLVLAGVVIGLVGAFALTRVMSSLLYGVSATDPLTFASVAALLSSVALLASYIPARRATKIDPGVALRYE